MGGRRDRRGDSDRYFDWLDMAHTDIESASILRAYGGDPDAVVFHCQQAVEKSLKGFLLFRTKRHYDGHNVSFLIKQAMRESWDFSRFLEKSTPLGRLYIETRYPADYPPELDLETVEGFFVMAEAVYRLACSKVFIEAKPQK